MRIGAHVRNSENPLGEAEDLDVDLVQLFLTDPQKWNKPVVGSGLEAVRDSAVDIVVHSSYVINVASLNNRIRIPSRKAVAQQADVAAEIGALGLVVHGGHVRDGEDPAEGVANWRKLFERQAESGGFAVPIWIENTAGGDFAMARRFDAISRLWDAVGEFGAGFCLDTCHAWAGGEDLVDAVERVEAITGRIDLVHLNNSRDEFDSARDRHANLESGEIEAEVLAAVAAAADAPVMLETPADGMKDDVAYLRSL
ncbi:deoxyribonuclease IV [Rhodococcus sp. BP-349]|uniref:deoxyribonuclease IV n=1 Tax=unclassified Rhodococcus (in: high G+C Gram-positive bacteria) TaxID=192944 RepID=UPI001C9BAC2F|nr:MULTISPECIES: deoxyribonuclease IV [unclassified Rhodococcus (in: high G+C Gram-positive bacteria)]MBY6539311.1 deoxyribonuclease IV [Rhodococcus sp. BP-363]MBY6544361.1 deoxyribonuclease IV [Rhodococcus sp. BP-369]MBY6563591.1 deoxyribonuclease IV [Rhodococcus sp. BP-370]MBY6577883.1 deoxyribonuclease IV [Rhodococcus sp. BP-364]MBY6587184.1 deoxyribonuclease IV [Rhodococcus sp. BP-358]